MAAGVTPAQPSLAYQQDSYTQATDAGPDYEIGTAIMAHPSEVSSSTRTTDPTDRVYFQGIIGDPEGSEPATSTSISPTFDQRPFGVLWGRDTTVLIEDNGTPAYLDRLALSDNTDGTLMVATVGEEVVGYCTLAIGSGGVGLKTTAYIFPPHGGLAP